MLIYQRVILVQKHKKTPIFCWSTEPTNMVILGMVYCGFTNINHNNHNYIANSTNYDYLITTTSPPIDHKEHSATSH